MKLTTDPQARERAEAALDEIADLLGLTDEEAEDLIGFRGSRVEMTASIAERLIALAKGITHDRKDS